MSLSIKSVVLKNYRNYSDRTVCLGQQSTILVGRNAAGKTNVIEALSVVLSGDGFRQGRWEDLIMQGSDRASVRVEAEGDGRHLEAVLEIEGNTRRLTVNGKKKRSPGFLLGEIPIVVFVPDDLRAVKDSAERRRNLVDSLGRTISTGYEALRAEYDRIVRQRNVLLKEGAAEDLLEPWNELLVAKGAALRAARKRLVERVAAHAIESYDTLSPGEDLSVEYRFKEVDEGPDALREALVSSEGEEMRRGVTVVGPHRDDVIFSVGGNEARVFCSQGQQRSIVLAWKLAEVRVVEDVTKRRPLILLDDVMSELDESRRESLGELLTQGFQSVITTTNIDYFDTSFIDTSTVVGL